MAFATRPPSIPPTDLDAIIFHCIHMTFTPQVPSEEIKYYDLDCQDAAGLWASDKSNLEGVLKVDTPEKGYFTFFVVFNNAIDRSILERRLSSCKNEVQFDYTEEGSKPQSISYKVKLSAFADLEVINKRFHDWVFSQLIEGLTQGKCSAYGAIWEGQTGFAFSSTPDRKKSLDLRGFLEGLSVQEDEVVYTLYRELSREAKARGLVEPEPQEKSSIDSEELGRALAKANQEFLVSLTQKGVIKTTPPRLHPFSGENLKDDVSFEQWAFEIRQCLKTHTEGSVKEAMTQCLKGATLEGVRNLGDDASVAQILEHLKGTFQGAAPFDSLLKNFFSLGQEDTEPVAKYAIRLESQLASIKWQYPEGIAPDTEAKYKRDRLFFGLHKPIRDSIRTAYKDPKVSYADLLRSAREVEEELEPSRNNAATKKETSANHKQKTKVASAGVAPGLDSQANIEKLAQAAQKCQEQQEVAQKLINELTSTLAAFKSPHFHFNPNLGQGSGSNQRGRGGNRWGWRGRGRGRGNGQKNSNGQSDQLDTASVTSGSQRQLRQPFCFYCKKHKAESWDHWPNRCALLNKVLDTWHGEQSLNGHRDNQGNSSGQH